MVKINSTNNTIEMTRGDTLRLYLTLKDGEGNVYTPSENDSIRFAMKKRYADTTPLILKAIPNDTLCLYLAPEDTKDLNYGEYLYDMEITYADGDVDTFIDRAKFRLTEEVY